MEDVIAEITSAETEKALRNMTNGKAIPDNLLVEVWESLGRTGVNLLRETLNKITDKEKIPDMIWRKSILIPILKLGYVEFAMAGNYSTLLRYNVYTITTNRHMICLKGHCI